MFARRKTGWIGFDIGATSVKAAQIVRTDAGCRIRSAAIVQRDQRWAPAHFAANQPRSSADEMRCAASLCDHLAGADAATLLPIALCDLLQMDAPAASRTAVRSSKRPAAASDLRRAIETETHHSLRERVFDHRPIATQAGKINVVTAPQAWADQISADVAAGGWRCRIVDALPWALARAASLGHPSKNGRPIAALDWGYGKSTLCLVQDGAPALVRSLKDCDFQSVLDTVSKGLRVDQQDAEALLQKHGLDSAPGADRRSAGVIEDLLELPLNRLAQALRRTLDYWRGVTRGQSPEVIYVFGGGGTLAGADRRLSEQLGVPVQPWSLPAEHPAEAQWLPPACLLGAAVGLSALAWEEL